MSSGIYYVEMLDVLRAAGCQVAENSITNGWQSRARSSGGFPAPPLAVFWHHTASATSPVNDLEWMINGCDDAPVGNVLLDRNGVYWPVAAGASNCAGKGGPATFSRGTIPIDGGNTRGWQIEAANNGVGETWPEVQIDAYFAGSNALSALAGNDPMDVITHALGTGNGWTDRKVDPARESSVHGGWQPGAASSSGTWNLDDIRVECARRAGSAPPDPIPTPPDEELDMPIICIAAGNGDPVAQAATFWWDGRQIGWVRSDTQVDLGRIRGVYDSTNEGPYRNLTVDQINQMIDSGWAGGPIPPGFRPPA